MGERRGIGSSSRIPDLETNFEPFLIRTAGIGNERFIETGKKIRNILIATLVLRSSSLFARR